MSRPTTIDLKDFRQPVVTSLGIILGFLLGFLGQWVTEESFALKGLGDMLTFIGSIVGALLLFTALFRMLSPSVLPEHALGMYHSVLRLYLAGVIVPLSCILISAFL